MGLSLFERYVFRKALISLLAAGGGLIAVVWIVRAIQRVDVLMSNGQGIFTYLSMTSLAVPTLAALVAPIALLIAFIRTVNGLNSDSELVVMNAAGASRSALWRPFGALGLLAAIFVYTLTLWVGPSSMQSLRGYITTMRADLVRVIIREGVFRDLNDGLTFHIASRAPGGVLKGVFILDGREDEENRTYLAEEGVLSKVLDQTFLVLKNGQIQRRPRDGGQLSIIRFDSYAFNLSTFSGGRASSDASPLELSTGDLLTLDPKSETWKYYEGRLGAELFARFFNGLYPLLVVFLIVAFIGYPVSNRQNGNIAAALAVLALIWIRLLAVAAEGAARNTFAFKHALWILPLSGMLFALFIYHYRDRIRVPRTVQSHLDDLLERLAPLKNAILGKLGASQPIRHHEVSS